MLLCSVARVLLFWIGATVGKPLHIQDGQQLMTPLLASLRNLMFLGNSSASLVNTSSKNAFDIKCDGSVYGFNPNIADCEQAKSYIVPDSDQLEFGERHTGLHQDVFPLPYAIFGGIAPSVSHPQRIRHRYQFEQAPSSR